MGGHTIGTRDYSGGDGAGDGTPRDKGKMHQQDALAIAQNGGAQDDDSDLDIDGDDLDDDMTGGISSSPSIEDGTWPVRDLMHPPRRLATFSVTASFTAAAQIPLRGRGPTLHP